MKLTGIYKLFAVRLMASERPHLFSGSKKKKGGGGGDQGGKQERWRQMVKAIEKQLSFHFLCTSKNTRMAHTGRGAPLVGGTLSVALSLSHVVCQSEEREMGEWKTLYERVPPPPILRP